jgi:mono/diheme cytochrome c family protein
MKKLLAIFILLEFSSLALFSQEWVVPADRKGKLSPFKFDDNTRKEGERIYLANCKSCHGTPGMANYQANLVPPPPDPVDEKMQVNLDGELYYKIYYGRGQMPAFRNSLTANELWNLVSYLRTFKKDYIQAIAPVIKSSAYPGAEIIVKLLPGPAENEITMTATAVSEKETVPVKGAGVRLFVKRTFGRMELDEEKITDKTGVAIFRVPEGLPGDTAGKLNVSAVFTDEEAFGSVSRDTLLKAGKKITPVSLTEPRAMWNVVRKAPVWIILSYAAGVLGVWGFILIIMLRLRDIFIIGDHLTKAEKK